jgi:putative endonuclease
MRPCHACFREWDTISKYTLQADSNFFRQCPPRKALRATWQATFTRFAARYKKGFLVEALCEGRDCEARAILRSTPYNVIMYYVYILQSELDSSLYIGFTPDLKSRFIKHNKGQVISTKDKIPWKLIYYEAYIERKDASGREIFLKSGSGWRFIKKQLKHHFEKNPMKNHEH